MSAGRQESYDVTVVGGGLIGGSLACALADTGLRIALVEAVAADAAMQPSYDERVIALAWGSRLILDAMGLWAALGPESAPIEAIHVSERGRLGATRIDRSGLGVEALGYVSPARALGAAIRDVLAHAGATLDVLCPAQVLEHRAGTDGVEVRVAAGGAERTLRSRLLVAADGGDSVIRRALGVEIRERAYGHDAVIATVTPEHPQHGVAYERFTDTGPLAMLPMTQGRYSVVWTCRESETAEILNLSDTEFLARLQERFGYRLGRLRSPSIRRAYPLKLVLSRETVGLRTVLIGNAAHTLHPVAGQGFNLGLRDVAALADVLAEALARGADPGAPETLQTYKQWRGRDQEGIATLTDALARLFANPWLPLRVARGAGLIALDLVPPARRLLARRFLGTQGHLPRLARGLSLAPPAAAPVQGRQAPS